MLQTSCKKTFGDKENLNMDYKRTTDNFVRCDNDMVVI